MEDFKTLFGPSKFRRQAKIFFEIYRQFGHEPSKRFACPSVDGIQLTPQLLRFALSFKGLI
jgi:hypothetical protein